LLGQKVDYPIRFFQIFVNQLFVVTHVGAFGKLFSKIT
jgi:hypothetical protein